MAGNESSEVPEEMEILIVPAGLYAVFNYRGKASEAWAFYQEIYSKWLPNSSYKLDDRPHLAIMGDKYKHEDPNSEEKIWIPIRGL